MNQHPHHTGETSTPERTVGDLPQSIRERLGQLDALVIPLVAGMAGESPYFRAAMQLHTGLVLPKSTQVIDLDNVLHTLSHRPWARGRNTPWDSATELAAQLHEEIGDWTWRT